MSLRLLIAPTSEIVTLSEAKSFMRVDHSDDDVLIDTLIKAARERIEGPEGKLNHVFMTQTWDLILDTFPSNEIMIPLRPVQSVDAVLYFDEDGVQQTVGIDDYVLDATSKPCYVIPVEDFDWPDTQTSANAVTVRFTAGYPAESGDEAANVPSVVKLVVMQLVLHWYEQRDLVRDGPQAAETPEFIWNLLQPYRMFLL